MTGDDTELVALIDNELDEEAKGRLLARLAGDDGRRKRYEELRDTGVLIASSLDALIENAPLPRLRAVLPSLGAARAGRWPFSGVALRDLAAGFVVGLLAAGLAAWVAFRIVLRPQAIGVTGGRRSRNMWSSIRTRPSRSGTPTKLSKRRSWMSSPNE
jgi:anti-sigma factor RsiW